jgi:hypothetical protein
MGEARGGQANHRNQVVRHLAVLFRRVKKLLMRAKSAVPGVPEGCPYRPHGA